MSGKKRPALSTAFANHAFVVVPRSGVSPTQQRVYEERIVDHGGVVIAFGVFQPATLAGATRKLVVIVGPGGTLGDVVGTSRVWTEGTLAAAAAKGQLVVVQNTWLEECLGASAVLPTAAWAVAGVASTNGVAAGGAGVSGDDRAGGAPTPKRRAIGDASHGGTSGGSASRPAPASESGARGPGALPRWWAFPVHGPFGDDRGRVPVPRVWFEAPAGGAAPPSVRLPASAVAAGCWHCTKDAGWRTTPLLCLLPGGGGVSEAALRAAAARVCAEPALPRAVAQHRSAFMSLTAAGLGEAHWLTMAVAASDARGVGSGGSGGGGGGAEAPAGGPFLRLPSAAAFDMDDTLIKPAGGAKFCNAATDWMPAHPAAFATLRALSAAGVPVVIVSNQGGIAIGRQTLAVVRARVESVLAAIAAPGPGPITAIIAPQHDFYRKPLPGMWWLAAVLRYVEAGGGSGGGDGGGDGGGGADATSRQRVAPPAAAASPADCVVVGDAAGRPKQPGIAAKDFAAGDVRFALAAGARFATPEAFFAAAAAAAPSGAPRNAVDALRQPAPQRAPTALDEAPHAAPGAGDGWCGAWAPARDIAPPGAPRVVSRAVASVSASSQSPHGGGYHGGAAAGGGGATAAAGGGASAPPPSQALARADGSREVLLLVGLPGVGKSTLALGAELRADTYRDDAGWGAGGSAPASASATPAASAPTGRRRYVRVNQDLLKTRARALDACRAVLASGASVVVDATNADEGARAEWTAAARAAGVPARALFIDAPKALALHLAALRAAHPLGGPDGPDDRRAVPAVAIHTVAKKLTAPRVEEGFEEVVTLRFVPDARWRGSGGGGAGGGAADGETVGTAGGGAQGDYAALVAAACDAADDLAESLVYAYVDG